MSLPAAPLLALALACGVPAPDLAGLEPPAAPAAQDGFDHTHALWTEVLQEHVEGDLFDYAALQRDTSKLDPYLGALQAVTREQHDAWTEDQRFAFWVNVYNAYTVKRVVEAYPVDSIKDLGGLLKSVWKQEFVPLNALHPEGEDEPLTLDEVEHAILRPRFEDPRVHAAVNCASKSCPPLHDRAFTAEGLDETLDRLVRAWLADPDYNRFDAASRTAHLSAIFDWFAGDFGETRAERLAWVARRAPEEHRAWLTAGGVTVRYLEYDWDLNDVPPPERGRAGD